MAVEAQIQYPRAPVVDPEPEADSVFDRRLLRRAEVVVVAVGPDDGFRAGS